ncbi:MAG: hypothetical protein GX878_09290 [Firmicutes bacterium]|nr:hypothetical protein [Bacillota bacterium]
MIPGLLHVLMYFPSAAPDGAAVAIGLALLGKVSHPYGRFYFPGNNNTECSDATLHRQ